MYFFLLVNYLFFSACTRMCSDVVLINFFLQVHEYNVDLMFAGHVHAYERTFPVYKNVVTTGATTYLNIGDGGNREGPASM
jgi:UDP-2,3-diacylglucosamine pyrophosphatase LpxH